MSNAEDLYRKYPSLVPRDGDVHLSQIDNLTNGYGGNASSAGGSTANPAGSAVTHLRDLMAQVEARQRQHELQGGGHGGGSGAASPTPADACPKPTPYPAWISPDIRKSLNDVLDTEVRAPLGDMHGHHHNHNDVTTGSNAATYRSFLNEMIAETQAQGRILEESRQRFMSGGGGGGNGRTGGGGRRTKTDAHGLMHVAGSRHCVDAGMHKRSGRKVLSTKSSSLASRSGRKGATKKSSTVSEADNRANLRILNDTRRKFQEQEAKLQAFALQLDRDQALGTAQTEQGRRSTELDQLKYAVLVQKLEEMNNLHRAQLERERERMIADENARNRERDAAEQSREEARQQQQREREQALRDKLRDEYLRERKERERIEDLLIKEKRDLTEALEKLVRELQAEKRRVVLLEEENMRLSQKMTEFRNTGEKLTNELMQKIRLAHQSRAEQEARERLEERDALERALVEAQADERASRRRREEELSRLRSLSGTSMAAYSATTTNIHSSPQQKQQQQQQQQMSGNGASAIQNLVSQSSSSSSSAWASGPRSPVGARVQSSEAKARAIADAEAAEQAAVKQQQAVRGDHGNVAQDMDVLKFISDTGGSRVVFSDYCQAFSGADSGTKVVLVLTDNHILIVSGRPGTAHGSAIRTLRKAIAIPALTCLALSSHSSEILTFNTDALGYTITCSRRSEVQDHVKRLFLLQTNRVLEIIGP